MGERRSILLKQIKYEGLFNVIDIFNLTDDWIKDKGYDRSEAVNEEIMGEKGKQIRVKFLPWKKTSDYAKNVLKLKFMFHEVNDVIVEIDGSKKKIQKGRVEVTIEGYIETDYEGKMQNRPFYFFMRELFDRFFYKLYTRQAEGLLIGDADQFWLLMRQYFNMHSSKKI